MSHFICKLNLIACDAEIPYRRPIAPDWQTCEQVERELKRLQLSQFAKPGGNRALESRIREVKRNELGECSKGAVVGKRLVDDASRQR